MREHEIVFNKTRTEENVNVWDDSVEVKTYPTTTVILLSNTDEELNDKIDKFYKGFEILSVKKVSEF